MLTGKSEAVRTRMSAIHRWAEAIADELSFLEHWTSVEAGSGFVNQLRSEAAQRHPLFDVDVEAVGRREDCDDVLFRLSKAGSRYAVVHLAWGGRQSDPAWPSTELFSDWAEFVEKRMTPDREDWE